VPSKPPRTTRRGEPIHEISVLSPLRLAFQIPMRQPSGALPSNAGKQRHDSESHNGRTVTTTQSPSDAEHHKRHIIVLGSARSERLCGGQDSSHAFQSWKPMTRFGELN
jgi:hypothetical protein